ncbi:MAG TPA: helix-turn-helix transcriptional regulator [Bacillota bacterium]|nr:helix-turn-helix transcriptional regulator [Bacillota bacterium]
MSVIENGNANPSVEVAKKIAAVLGFDWVWFFDDKQNSKEPAPTGTEG